MKRQSRVSRAEEVRADKAKQRRAEQRKQSRGGQSRGEQSIFPSSGFIFLICERERIRLYYELLREFYGLSNVR